MSHFPSHLGSSALFNAQTTRAFNRECVCVAVVVCIHCVPHALLFYGTVIYRGIMIKYSAKIRPMVFVK